MSELSAWISSHPIPAGERLARLEADMEALKDDVAEIKDAVKEISEVFLKARGFKSALFVFGTIFLFALGYGSKQVIEFIFSVLRP